LRKDIDEAFKRNSLRYEVIIESDVAENIKKYVEMGLGISILSALAITESDKRTFLFKNVDHLLKHIDYGIYYRKGTFITTPMREFIRVFAPNLLRIGEGAILRDGVELKVGKDLMSDSSRLGRDPSPGDPVPQGAKGEMS
jgi:hypothetical protein